MSIIPKLFHSWLLKCVIMCWIFLFHTCNESDTIAKAVAPAVMILIFQRKKIEQTANVALWAKVTQKCNSIFMPFYLNRFVIVMRMQTHTYTHSLNQSALVREKNSIKICFQCWVRVFFFLLKSVHSFM